MPEMVPGSPLDRLHWLVKDKLSASEVEELGASFNPQFHFLALLPSPALPPGETEKVERYFAAMVEALAPVRDSIAAYWLRGVMSRTPVSDFSLEVQFSDPFVIEKLRRSLPRELSASVIATQRRAETTPTSETETEASMFFRNKNTQDNPEPANSAPASTPAPAPEAAPANESAAPDSALRVVTIAPPVAAAVLPQAAPAAPIAAPIPSWEPGRKRMLVAEGVTLQGGEILGCAHLAIEGEAYSTISRCEKLEIMASGIFKGTASVADAEISGYCSGTLVVAGTLRITRTGHVAGAIECGRLQVEDGGRFEGEMKMARSAGEPGRETQADNPRWVELSTKLSA